MVDVEAQGPESLTVIRTREQLRERLTGLGWWVSVPLTTFPAHWLYEGEQRLDASYYADETLAALRIVRDSGFTVKSLKVLGVTAYHPTQSQPRSNFKRIYATPDTGVPFLTASQMYAFCPTSDKYLSKTMKKLDELFVQPWTLLLSRSGTVAIPILVNRRLSRFAITDDAIRVTPGTLPGGYLYAFLSSWIGRALLSKSQYGVTVKHLEAAHLLSIECPLLPDAEQRAIHNQVLRAYTMRDEANDLLDEADEMLHHRMGLPHFDESLVPYLPPPLREETGKPEMPHPCAFTVKASELSERLDASYHVPVARTVVALLHKGKYPPVRLGQLARNVFIPPRFKRIYVRKEYGVPFLQGSHLPKMQPYDLKYLSRTNTRGLERWIVRKGWVLVTCSGTIGRVGLVSSAQDQWAASQHLLRIVPDPSRGHPGYLVAFLMTPYGQHQLTAKIYGGVVDELTEDDTKAVWIPDASPDVQASIGQRVVSGFEKKDEATAIEEAAIRRLETTLEKSIMIK